MDTTTKWILAFMAVLAVIVIAWLAVKAYGRDRFCGSGGCDGGVPAPAAMAEYQGLRQLGWRPDGDLGYRPGAYMQPRPSCSGPDPSAIAEAQALQSAQALGRHAPYYTKSTFASSAADTLDDEVSKRIHDSQKASYKHLQDARGQTSGQMDARRAVHSSAGSVFDSSAKENMHVCSSNCDGSCNGSSGSSGF